MNAPHTLDLSRLRTLEASKSAALGKISQLFKDHQTLEAKETQATKELTGLRDRLEHYGRHGSDTDLNSGADRTGPVLRGQISDKEREVRQLEEDIAAKEAEMRAANEEATAANQLYENCRKYAERLTHGE